jgi:uncharacterized protein
MQIRTRETSWLLVGAYLAILFSVPILSLVVFREPLMNLSMATGFMLPVDLIPMALGIVLGIGVVLLAVGRFRLSDLGLTAREAKSGIVATAAIWILMQLVLLVAALRAGPLTLEPQIAYYGWGPMIAFTLTMLLGTAVYEEVSFRSFLLPQLYLKFRDYRHIALPLAIVVAAVIFAIIHIPTRIIIGGHDLPGLAAQMLVLTMVGVFGALAYLRTGNIVLIMGVHGVYNSPLAIVASPVAPWMVLATIVVPVIIAWPWIVGSDRGWARIVDRDVAAAVA